MLTALDEADLVLFVVDGRAGVTRARRRDRAACSAAAARPVVLVANKVDVRRAWRARRPISTGSASASPLPVSAEHGRGVAELLEVAAAIAPRARRA